MLIPTKVVTVMVMVTLTEAAMATIMVEAVMVTIMVMVKMMVMSTANHERLKSKRKTLALRKRYSHPSLKPSMKIAVIQRI